MMVATTAVLAILGERRFEKSGELLRAYGLTSCANGIRQSREERKRS